jgi:hypothetical protein
MIIANLMVVYRKINLFFGRAKRFATVVTLDSVPSESADGTDYIDPFLLSLSTATVARRRSPKLLVLVVFLPSFHGMEAYFCWSF